MKFSVKHLIVFLYILLATIDFILFFKVDVSYETNIILMLVKIPILAYLFVTILPMIILYYVYDQFMKHSRDLVRFAFISFIIYVTFAHIAGIYASLVVAEQIKSGIAPEILLESQVSQFEKVKFYVVEGILKKMILPWLISMFIYILYSIERNRWQLEKTKV